MSNNNINQIPQYYSNTKPSTINVFKTNFASHDPKTRTMIVQNLSKLSECISVLQKKLDNNASFIEINNEVFDFFNKTTKPYSLTIKHFAQHNAINSLIQATHIYLGLETPDNFKTYYQSLDINLLKSDVERLSTQLGNWLINNYDIRDTVFNNTTFNVILDCKSQFTNHQPIYFGNNIALIADIRAGSFIINNGKIIISGSDVKLTASGINTEVLINGDNAKIILSESATACVNSGEDATIYSFNAITHINGGNSIINIISPSQIIAHDAYNTQVIAYDNLIITYNAPNNYGAISIECHNTNHIQNIHITEVYNYIPYNSQESYAEDYQYPDSEDSTAENSFA